MSAARPGGPAGTDTATAAPDQTDTAAPVRHRRLRDAAARRGVPLATILVSVAVVVLTYLAGKLAYRIRDVLLMIAVAGFVCLILNPLVVALQRWGIRRRGGAVAIVAIWTVAVFIGLLAAFGYPLAHGVTHFSHGLPSYVQAAEHGRGWIGHLVRRFHLEAWVNRNAPKLQSLGATLAKPALTAGKGAVSVLATLATIFALIVLFLLEGPKIENHVLNPVIMSRTANVNPLLVLLSLLVGTSIGDWVGGFFGSFVGALLAIPAAGALQVIARELWQASARRE